MSGMSVRSAVMLRLILVVILLLAVGPIPTSSAAGKPGSTSWKYTALGDSVATGFGAIRGYVPRYKGYIETDTGASVSLSNLAQNGWTSSDLLNALRTDRKFRNGVSGARVVSWNIGGNDLRAARDSYKNGTCGDADNQKCLRDTVVRLKSNWNAIIVEILSLRSTSNTIIRTMDIYNPYVDRDKVTDSWAGDDGLNDFEVFKPYLDDVNSHIATTSVNNNVPYAQVYLAFNGLNGEEDPGAKGYIGLDGLHPNDTGHEVIANNLRQLGYSPLK